jgi:hypothetical protein
MSLIGEMKEVADLIKKIGDLDLYKKIVDLQAAVVDLSGKNVELHEANAQLSAKLKKADDWKEQEKRYALVTPWQNGAQAYSLRESEAKEEQPHLLCANCFHESKRSVLSPVNVQGWISMKCASCRGEMTTGYRAIGAPQFAERYLERDKKA